MKKISAAITPAMPQAEQPISPDVMPTRIQRTSYVNTIPELTMPREAALTHSGAVRRAGCPYVSRLPVVLRRA